MKIEKTKLPTELLLELVHFFPFNIKWDKIRVSKNFDLFIHKFQKKWIVRAKNPDLIINKFALRSAFDKLSQQISWLNGVEEALSPDVLDHFVRTLDLMHADYSTYAQLDLEIEQVRSRLGDASSLNASSQVIFKIRRARVAQLIQFSITAIGDSVSNDFFYWDLLSGVLDYKLSMLVNLASPYAIPLPSPPSPILCYGGFLLICILVGYNGYKKYVSRQ